VQAKRTEPAGSNRRREISKPYPEPGLFLFPLPCPDIPPQRDPGDTECLADLTDAIVLVGFLLRDVGDLDEEAVKREMRRYP